MPLSTAFLFGALMGCAEPEPSIEAADTQVEGPPLVESQFLGDAGRSGHWNGGSNWEGVEAWSITVPSSSALWPPSVSDELFFVQMDGRIEARTLANADLIWSQPLQSLDTWKRGFTPALVGGTIYALAWGDDQEGDGLVVMEAMDAETGEFQWGFSLPLEAFFLDPQLSVTETHAVLVLPLYGLIVLDLGLKSEVWRMMEGDTSHSPILLEQQLFLLSVNEQNIYMLEALDAASGQQSWSAQVDLEIATSEAYLRTLSAADGQVYLVDGQQGVRAFDASSGEQIWAGGQLSYGHFTAHGSYNIVVSDDTVVVQDEAALRLYDASSGESLGVHSNPVGSQNWLSSAGDLALFGGKALDLRSGEQILSFGEYPSIAVPAGSLLLNWQQEEDRYRLTAWE